MSPLGAARSARSELVRLLEEDGPDLEAAFLRVQRELRTRYLLRFTPADGKPGYWRPPPAKAPVGGR